MDSSGGPEWAHATFEAHAATAAEVERVWREYWVPMLRLPDGRLNVARLKGELYDAWWLVDQARLVYRHVTGGLTDDLTASAAGVIALADRVTARAVERAVRELAGGEARASGARAGGLAVGSAAAARGGGSNDPRGGSLRRGVADGAHVAVRDVVAAETRDGGPVAAGPMEEGGSAGGNGTRASEGSADRETGAPGAGGEPENQEG